MRISIHTLGTRGDVQPYVALARALVGRGHAVQLAAPAQFEGFVTARGIAFVPLPEEFLALLDTPEAKALAGGRLSASAVFKLVKRVGPLMRRLFDADWDAARAFRPDLLLYHPKSIAVPYIARRLQVNTILASPLPGFTPTSAFPSPMLPFASLGPLNRASHQLAIRGGAVLFGRILKDWCRQSLQLAEAAPAAPVATLYGYSRQVVPVPPDWDDSVLVSGYWFLDDAVPWHMPDALADFLARGETPVYVGFGSMPGRDPQRLADTVIGALARAGKRAILASGGGALAVRGAHEHVYVLEAAPHDQLFRHVSAALHHGGAGSTGASLRAGLPTIVSAFFGDQPFWGRRVAALGAGPQPLRVRKLDAHTLAAAFLQTDDPAMRRQAAELGRAIRQEDGIGEAVRFIERIQAPWRDCA